MIGTLSGQPSLTMHKIQSTDSCVQRRRLLAFGCPSMNKRDFSWAQKRVRVLSGLHGLLRPLIVSTIDWKWVPNWPAPVAQPV